MNIQYKYAHNVEHYLNIQVGEFFRMKDTEDDTLYLKIAQYKTDNGVVNAVDMKEGTLETFNDYEEVHRVYLDVIAWI